MPGTDYSKTIKSDSYKVDQDLYMNFFEGPNPAKREFWEFLDQRGRGRERHNLRIGRGNRNIRPINTSV